jgi:hypothetical protein
MKQAPMSCLLSVASVVLLAGLLSGLALAAPLPTVATSCRQDLAKRLKLKLAQVQVAKCEATTFPDTGLGLPRPGQMYAQVITAGYRLTLTAKGLSYLYTASARSFHYGGPADSWRYSALYLEAVPDEPNLNGNLYQVSLIGTDPRLLLQGASDIWPQARGAILATRRTSRSGFDLIHVATEGTATPLGGAFAYHHAVVNSAATQWAALLRPMLGAGWQMAWGLIGDTTRPPRSLDLPPGSTPVRVCWPGERPLIEVREPDKTVAYELNANGDGWEKTDTYLPPEGGEMMLNKSETLVVKTEEVDGKPVTRVVRQWFTGAERLVATLRDFTAKSASITPEKRFVLLSGPGADKQQAFAVDLASGEVIQTVREAMGPARLFLAPPDLRRRGKGTLN